MCAAFLAKSGKTQQNLAKNKHKAKAKAKAKNKARDKAKRDYSLAQRALPGCGRSAQSAPLAQLALRLCARSCSHEKCARWRVIFTAAAKIGQMPVRKNRVIRHLFRV